MSHPDDLLQAAEKIIAVLAQHHLDAVVIGAVARAAYHYEDSRNSLTAVGGRVSAPALWSARDFYLPAQGRAGPPTARPAPPVFRPARAAGLDQLGPVNTRRSRLAALSSIV